MSVDADLDGCVICRLADRLWADSWPLHCRGEQERAASMVELYNVLNGIGT